MQIKLEKLSSPQTYFNMTQTLLPRPIAWILTENEGGDYNLAPYSYFSAVCSDPALLMVSIGLQDDGREKDTLRNIRERSQFVIHIASCDQLADLNQTSATLPPGESEVTANKLKTTAIDGVHMPRLTDCKIAFICESYDIQEIGNNSQHLLFAEIREIYIDDDCTSVDKNRRIKIHADKIQPLGRLGASEYVSFGEILSAKRPA